MANVDINGKTTINAIDSADQVFVSDGGVALKKIGFNNISKALLEQYAGTQLGGVARTAKDFSDVVRNSQRGWLIKNVNGNIDDLYTEDTCGCYWLNNGSTDITGTKPSASGQGLLIVKRQSTDLFRQVYIPITSGMDFVGRYYNGTTWTNWSYPDLSKRIQTGTWRIVGTSAGNTREEVLATIDGFFDTPGASHMSGYCNGTAPALLGLPNASYYLDMYANSENYRIVTARSTNAMDIFQLTKTGGTWADSWVKIGVQTSGATETVTANETDLNNYLTPGTYFFNSSTKALNAPVDFGYYQLIVTAPVGVLSGTNRTRHQRALLSDGREFVRWLRSSDAGETWTVLQDWMAVPTGNDFNRTNQSLNIIQTGSTITDVVELLSPGFYIYCSNSSATAVAQGSPVASPMTYYVTVYETGQQAQILGLPWAASVSHNMYFKRLVGGSWKKWVQYGGTELSS